MVYQKSSLAPRGSQGNHEGGCRGVEAKSNQNPTGTLALGLGEKVCVVCVCVCVCVSTAKLGCQRSRRSSDCNCSNLEFSCILQAMMAVMLATPDMVRNGWVLHRNRMGSVDPHSVPQMLSWMLLANFT